MSSTTQDFFTGGAQYSRLTVDIFGAAGCEDQTIRVSAGVMIDGTRGNMGPPSEEAKSEAQALVTKYAGSAGALEPI